jgi:hypothetical protein
MNIIMRLIGQEQTKMVKKDLGEIRGLEDWYAKSVSNTTQRLKEKTVGQTQATVVSGMMVTQMERGTNSTMIETVMTEANQRAQQKRMETLRMLTIDQLLNSEITLVQADRDALLAYREEILLQQKFKMLAMEQKLYRQRLMSTMAIFGMTMTIWQMNNAMSRLVDQNSEAGKAIQKVGNVMMGATAPAMMFNNIMMMTAGTMTMVKAAALNMIPAVGAIMAIYVAMTAQGRKVRALFGAIAGVMVVLTAKTIAYTIAKWSQIAAEVTWRSVLSMGVLLPILLGIVAAAVGGVAAYATAQTRPMQHRVIKETGAIYAHKGEVIARPAPGSVTPPMESAKGGGPQQVVIPVSIGGHELETVIVDIVDNGDRGGFGVRKSRAVIG